MIFIERPETNPFFNIAAEEYVLKYFEEDVLMLWQSEASVVVGKHQNTLKEVNLDFIRQNNVLVIRRISGGGTVYHDLGNLNYTLISTGSSPEKLIDFHKFTAPVRGFLKTLGIQSEFEGKNNMTIKGRKFSGNSAHVFKKRVMHHGTLLFETNLERLEKSILPGGANIRDKAVQSVRATVGNIAEHLPADYSIEQFKNSFKRFLLAYFHISEIRPLSPADKAAINKLADEKYKQWKWNYGYSPAYTFQNEVDGLSLKLAVKNGIIIEVEIDGELGGKMLLQEKLVGLAHHPKEITDLIEAVYSNGDNSLAIKLFGF
ncbi:MAG: lipoate--protein ligase [Bacteroidales bacterium]|nr:lipoate--protein ligase [Bacteroidales bacterium]